MPVPPWVAEMQTLFIVYVWCMSGLQMVGVAALLWAAGLPLWIAAALAVVIVFALNDLGDALAAQLPLI